MQLSDIPNLRLQNQQITSHIAKTPQDLVSYLGAVQSQDFYGAVWALGLRLPGSTFAGIEKDFNEGKILRTHALRPTWHFVTPEDIRWIMDLNAPQVKKVMGYYNNQLDINDKLLKKTNQIIKSFLKGKPATRTQISADLKKNGIAGTGQRIGHIIGWAELDNIICSGPRIGKQFTYALLDEVAPKTKEISRDESLGKLAEIFFKTRGPATIKDFSKWSYLSQLDCKKGLDSVKSKFQSENIEGKEYFFVPPSAIRNAPSALLLPNYDEYISSYADFSIISTEQTRKNLDKIGNAVFWNHMVSDGNIVGSWRRVFKPKSVEIELAPLAKLSKEDTTAFDKAALDFGKFYGFETVLR